MKPVRMTRAELQTQTRERLLAAAERVLAQHGYAGASIDLISAEAGYSKGAVYSNFESKEAVFLELLRRYMARSLETLKQAARLDGKTPEAAIATWLEQMQGEGDCLMLTAELKLQARRSPAFAGQYYALQAQQTKELARMLERYFAAMATPLPMPANDLAETLIVLAHGLPLQTSKTSAGKAGTAGRVIGTLLRLMTRAR